MQSIVNTFGRVLRRSLKSLPPLQPHRDLRLQLAWNYTQLGLLLLPFSSLLGVLACLVGAIMVWRQRFRQMITQPINWGFGLLSLLMLISAALAHLPQDALLGLFNFLPFFFGFAALSELIQTPAQLRRLAWLMVVPSVLVVLIGFAQLAWGWLGHQQIVHVQILWIVIDWVIDPNGTPPSRMSAVLTYANVLANYLVITFILGLGLWIETMLGERREARGKGLGARGWGLGKNGETADQSAICNLQSAISNLRFHKILLTSAVLLNVAALVLTNSRNAWAIVIVACLIYGLYLGWRWLLLGAGALAGAVLGAAFAPSPIREGLRAIVPAFFWARLTDQLYPNRPIPTLRITQWQFALSLTQQRPWIGWGLRNFNPLYEAQTHFDLGHPHNLPLMLLCETGIPATLLFLGLVGWMVFRGLVLLWSFNSSRFPLFSGRQGSRFQRNQRRDRLILFSFLLAFLSNTVFNLFDITLFDARMNLMGWIVLAGIWGVSKREEGGRRREEGEMRKEK
ncbi:MAG: O-antigen ligase family protein [Leptolyngbyaceae cyanobacterium RU_5_1]|nr:O-antigen ligase family protein [Leptolyngbyaceae cyanobacterium RU_5_1]